MKIAVIGAGPAGISTSYFLRDLDLNVCLFEQNKNIGEKLKLTGGGRMNVTNRIFSMKKFFSSNQSLLKNLLKNPWFNNRREELFEELGIKYKYEGDRAILVSEDAISEVNRFYNLLKNQKNLSILTGCKVQEVKNIENKFNVIFEQNDFKKEEKFDIVVIANGGMFRIKSSIDPKELYKIPLKLGHTITDLKPLLCPIIIPNNPFKDFAGISFSGRIYCPLNKKSVIGDILITNNGISGPAVFDFSAIIEGACAELCFIENLTEENFVKEFKKLRIGKETVKKFINKFLPNRICKFLMNKNGITNEMKISTIKKELLKKLQQDLFHFKLENIELMNYKFAWTTNGGIKLNDVNISTLESLLHKNIFFAGEVLDVNGLCGGYNISFALISGKIVSEAIQKYFQFFVFPCK